ncbi:Cell division control protein 14 [Bienertia sinuspersici]
MNRKKQNPPTPPAVTAESPTTPSESPSSSAANAAVESLVASLKQSKMYREVTLALRSGLRDAQAEFSFLRVRGLRCLLKFLRSVADSDDTIRLFCLTQSLTDLQVIPVLFQHTLKDTEEESVTSLDHIFTVEPMKLTSPSTDTEVALALRVLEGCCLIHRQSTILAHQHKAIPVLMDILSSRGVLEQGACLDALIALMLDSTVNQMDFETCNGIEEVAAIIRDKQVDENLRMKCGEFLLLLIGHVDGRDMQPMASVHDDIRRLLGEKSASLIWAASQFGSTLDPEERMTALQIQARRVLESLDLFGV